MFDTTKANINCVYNEKEKVLIMLKQIKMNKIHAIEKDMDELLSTINRSKS